MRKEMTQFNDTESFLGRNSFILLRNHQPQEMKKIFLKASEGLTNASEELSIERRSI